MQEANRTEMKNTYYNMYREEKMFRCLGSTFGGAGAKRLRGL